MEAIVLKNYETFDEIPNGLLLVKENSNLMHVRIENSSFIAREFIDSIEFESEYINYIISYFNVENNENILTLTIKKSVRDNSVEMLEQSKNIEVIPLNILLNISKNKMTYLSFQDIDSIVNFRWEYIPGKKNSII